MFLFELKAYLQSLKAHAKEVALRIVHLSKYIPHSINKEELIMVELLIWKEIHQIKET